VNDGAGFGGHNIMSSILQEDQVFNNEVPFCTIYSQETKKMLEETFLKHRVSYYVEWQDKTFWQRIFGGRSAKDRITCTIRINKADIERAHELVKDFKDIKFRDYDAEESSSDQKK
jgi:hypothetical protein